jgi:hypothetical protein
VEKHETLIKPDGTICWLRGGQLHREDGPAVIHTNGDYSWYFNGLMHREGPNPCTRTTYEIDFPEKINNVHNSFWRRLRSFFACQRSYLRYTHGLSADGLALRWVVCLLGCLEITTSRIYSYENKILNERELLLLESCQKNPRQIPKLCQERIYPLLVKMFLV